MVTGSTYNFFVVAARSTRIVADRSTACTDIH
jgi:hypothetical protein